MKLKLLIVMGAAAAIFVASGRGFAETTISGNISTDTTWSVDGSPYIVTSNITVQGTDGDDGVTTLTLEPGVELRFNASRYLYIGGASGNPGAVSAVGTSENPITFTANGTSAWCGLYFRNTTHDVTSVLDHCIIEKAAVNCARMDDANPAIRNSIIRDSGGYGVYLYKSSPELTGNTISNNATYGIFCSNTLSRPSITNNTLSGNGSYPMQIGANLNHIGNTFSGNTNQAVELLAETIANDMTWKNIGIPYIIKGTFIIQGTDGDDSITTLTIEPGVELRFNPSCYLYIGNTSGTPGAIAATGSVDAPILFTANQANPWYGIYFRNTSNDTICVLDHCIIEKAATHNIQMEDASPSIINSVIAGSNGNGIYMSGLGTNNSVIECNTIKDNQYGIYTVGCSSMTIANNTITTNSLYGIYHTNANALTAANNWWGSPNGPGDTGSIIHGNVVTEPFLTSQKNCNETDPDADSDNDGLPDAWEIANFGDLAHDKNSDDDGDTYSNGIEYILGTNPVDSGSIPANKTRFDYNSGGRIKSIQ